MSLIKLIEFKNLGDERGNLVSFEGNKNIPFEIKRVYCIYATKQNVVRGLHAHKKLKQVAIALKGSCKFVLDDGLKREEILLDIPTHGLLIDSCTWREMHDFSDDCVLMVLASDIYDEDDYIRDYQNFLQEIKKC
ncbi:WxcM-like domain-containing protein [Shewanella sp. ZOR0012]|uniref:FdtA/QdtA family cupin domain-containing protein n=1 Tax=Shewanella xiamenensis TaxID=332186 RepID=A0ABT6UA41_9GAMM|nr:MULTISPECIES: FdtA/QdtA family cupin domain-containing protein [Shewanella]MCH7422834.1 FdtA/QdtA family cupin domain-containing protein [Shewanella sp. MM_2022_3]MDI5831226.1 FdtA/QdtA family cupin domain-containing protein [Shewanella xiamenensis]NSM23804.1 WxcM-like domain-containing protein [Shewanella sp. ZOR0012]UML95030.1 FdtA/QdtA family cupin domain-containing protein [Shewanella xiamenensis]